MKYLSAKQRTKEAHAALLISREYIFAPESDRWDTMHKNINHVAAL